MSEILLLIGMVRGISIANKIILYYIPGHACAEYSGSVYTVSNRKSIRLLNDIILQTFKVIYLYKYLFKGATKASLRLTNADDVSDKDELTLYIRGRYLCSGKCKNRKKIICYIIVLHQLTQCCARLVTKLTHLLIHQ